MADTISPLAPKGGFPELPEISGVKYASIATGVKYSGRDDVMLVELAPGTSVSGVYTKSRTRSAAVEDCVIKTGGSSEMGAAFLVNSGNANAFTGGLGPQSVGVLTKEVAAILGIPETRVFTASTGVIGEPLDPAKITSRLQELHSTAAANGANSAAHAIMTTDTFAKGSRASVELSGGPVHLAGFAKGSGMIAPDMATMLSFVFTDAAIAQPVLQQMVSRAAAETFNCITVDSDTSTSDTLLVAATGMADSAEITGIDTVDGELFFATLKTLMLDLAHQVVRDGEGASKFVAVRITGADTQSDARTIGKSIANSPLVKTAIAGEDPNWGRVVMAIGKSGANADRDRLSIWFGDILVAKDGWVSPDYSEQAGVDYMKSENIDITVDLALGDATATIWTCDLTHGYIEINADYRS